MNKLPYSLLFFFLAAKTASFGAIIAHESFPSDFATTPGSGVSAWTGSTPQYDATNLTFGALPSTDGSLSMGGVNNEAVFAQFDLTNPLLAPYIGAGSAIGDANSGTLYMSVLLQYNAYAGASLNNSIGISLFNVNSERNFVGKLGSGQDFSSSQLSSGGNWAPLDNNTHLLVMKIEFGANGGDNDKLSLFWDPTPGSSEPVTVTATGSTSRDYDFTRVRFGVFANQQLTDVRYDELRLGTTFEAVTAVAIPEPSNLGLIAALSLSSFVLISRRRLRS